MIRVISVLVLGAALSGCVSLGGKPPESLLSLSSVAQVAANDSRTAQAGEAITIHVPVVPQALASNRVLVMSGATALAYVKDAVWAEPPARLFQRVVSETVAAKTGRVVLDVRQLALDQGLQVTGTLSAFGIDSNAGQAVVTYDAAMTADHGRTVRTRRFDARVPLGEIKPDSAGRALNAAANKVAEDVAGWIAG